jgi:hypothetical protein
MDILQPQDQPEQDPVWDYSVDLGPLEDPDYAITPDPIELRLRYTYRERQDSWYLDIFSPDDERVSIFTGWRMTIMMPGGMADYEIPELPREQFITVLDRDNSWVEAGYEDLGRRCEVIHSDRAEWNRYFVELLPTLNISDPILIGIDEPATVYIVP